jgi:dihydropteroate synthase
MFTLNCNGRLLVIEQPIVMGIINATPDSFYSASRQATVDAALAKAEQLLSEGAVILDIGGQSTRPGSQQIDVAEERTRVLPLLEAISKRFPQAFISVDTYHSELASAAVAHGASIINDISGGLFDAAMLDTVASLQVPYICMHLKGTPGTMHEIPKYENLVQEVLDHFIQRIEACRQAGIVDIIIDPGFGFSKTATHNFELIKNLELFAMLKKPLLLGISRKSTIYKTLEIPVEESLNGTTVLHTAGLLKGANILRVHDVKEAMQAIKLCSLIG